MRKITLVCSGHSESGRCNAEELLNIFKAIKPEVAFLEMCPSEFDFFYERGSVEAHAITKYRECKPIPVDQDVMPRNLLAEFKRDLDIALARVAGASPEYRWLNQEKNKSVYEYGFAYLNSVVFARLSARMTEIEDEIIGGTDDQDLIRVLERWRHIIRQREHAMVRNIYEHCRKNVFDTGVFLVGAAHKMAIIKEIENRVIREADLISWTITYDGQIP